MKRKILFTAGVLIFLAAAALSVQRTPQPPMFCDQCVMQRDVTEWRLAGRWKLFTTAAARATPVSELLAEHQACPAHAHKWSAPTEVAVAELETSDAPRVRSIGLLNTPRTASFLRGVFEYADKESTTTWRAVAWQPLYASALEPALRFCRYPENGFSGRGEFLAWWSQSSYPLFNRLHEMTEAD